MSREPDLDAVNRALSVTVQKQERELARLSGVLRWIAEQVEEVPADGAVSILLAEIGSRVWLALTESAND
jgi:hypothetical protein